MMSSVEAHIWYAESNQGYVGFRNWRKIDATSSTIGLNAQNVTGWVEPISPWLASSSQPNRDVIKFESEAEWKARRESIPPPQSQYELGPAISSPKNPVAGSKWRVIVKEIRCPEVVRLQRDLPAGQFEHVPCDFVVNAGMPDLPSPSEKTLDPAITRKAPPDWRENGVCLDLTFADGVDRVDFEYLESHDGLNTTLLLAENVDAGDGWESDEPRVGFLWQSKEVRDQVEATERVLGINQETGQGDGSTRFARLSSLHLGGVNVAFCGGATQFLSAQIDPVVLEQLMAPDNANARPPGMEKR
jgi:Protein of unknown function (DUF1559)